MAATLTVVAATQEMLRITAVTANEGGDSGELTQAQLIAACAAGPLKSLFVAPLENGAPGPGADTWSHLYKDARLSVVVASYGAAEVAASYVFGVNSGVNVLDFFVGSAGTAIYELRFNNSLIR